MRLVLTLALAQLTFAIVITNDLVARGWTGALYAGGISFFLTAAFNVGYAITTMTPQGWAVAAAVTICGDVWVFLGMSGFS